MTDPRPSVIDRSLRVFSDVRPGEGGTVLLMLMNIFLVLTSYYVLKTVREPLILAGGGAEVKTYASAGQAVVLVGFVPLYSWFASKVPRFTLINGVTLFFVACIALFYGLAQADVPYLGVAFYIWVGIFSVSIIAQFWSYANDIYSRTDGERLFPVIAIGATGGAAGGAWLAARLFELGIGAYEMMLVAAAMLVASVGIYAIVDRRMTDTAPTGDAEQPAKDAGGGFGLVLRSPYLRLIALLLILLNLVNTTGEYVLSSFVEEAARAVAEPGTKEFGAYIGSFYGDYFFYVNIGTILIQAFLVSRIVKYLGVAGVIFALPIVSLSAYVLIAAGSGLAIVRWAKSAENMTDYSVMNTGKAMLWLPTSREEKYKAKQAVDTFFVRLGDVLAAGLVFAGTTWLGFERGTFVLVNIGVIGVWLAVTWGVFRNYRGLAEQD